MLYRGVLWKEWREQAAILIALVVMGGGVIVAVSTFSGRSNEEKFDLRALSEPSRLTVLMLALTAGTVVGGSLFAGEDEAGTSSFLGFLPATRWRVWRAKMVAGFVLATVSGGLLILTGMSVGAFGVGKALAWAWIGIAGVVAAYGWGTVGSTTSRSTLAACGMGIIAAGFSGIGLLFALVVVAELFLNRTDLDGRQVGIVYAYPFLMIVLPYLLSGFIYSRPDRARRAEEMTPGTIAATVRSTRQTSRRAGRSRTGFGLRGLMWLLYRQYRVAALVVGLFAAFAGLLFLADDVPMMAGWPAATALLGVLAGVIGWADEQGRGTSLFWGERRIPGGRLWAAKVAAGFGMTFFWCLLFYLPSFIRAVVDQMPTTVISAFRCGLLPQDFGVIGLLAVWPVYGFVCGHLAGMLFEKVIVSAGTALLTAMTTAALWFPSFVSGGANPWHWLFPALVILVVARLLIRPWASNRIATRRPLVALGVGLTVAVLLIAGGAAWRAVEVPEIPEAEDDLRFAETIPNYDENEAGRELRSGVNRYQQAVSGADSWNRRPPAPLFPADPDGQRFVRDGTMSQQLYLVLRHGWPANRPDLDEWMDRMCAPEGNPKANWEDSFFAAVRKPPGSLVDLVLTNSYTPNPEVFASREVAIALLARGLHLQARGDPEAFLPRLDAVLCLARSMRFKSATTTAIIGRQVEAIAFDSLDRWLEQLAGRPDLLRRATDILTRHDATVNTDWNEVWLAERTVVRNTISSPAVWGDKYLRGVHGEMNRRTQRVPGGLDDRIKAEGNILGFVSQVPWERERQRRLIGLGNDPTRHRVLHEYAGGAYWLWPQPYRDFSTGEKPVRAASRAAALRTALRAYQAEVGRMPESLDQLVPKYLPAVPPDPFDGKPFRYRVSTGESILMEIIPRQDDAAPIGIAFWSPFGERGLGLWTVAASVMSGLVRWEIGDRPPPGFDPDIDERTMDAVAAVTGAVVQWPLRPLTTEAVALGGQFPDADGPFPQNRRRPPPPLIDRRANRVLPGQAILWAVGNDLSDDGGWELFIARGAGVADLAGDLIYIVPPPAKPAKK